MTKRRTYSPEFKTGLVLEVLKGTSTIAALAAKTGVPAARIAIWEKQAVAGLPGVFAAKAPPTGIQNWLSEVMARVPVVVAVKDLKLRYLYGNDHFYEIYGTGPDHVVGRTATEIFAKDISDGLNDRDREVLDTGKATQREDVLTYADGSRHVHMTQRFPIRGLKGEIVGLGSVAADATEEKRIADALKQSERRLLDVINNAPSSITLKDLDGRYLVVNEEVARRFATRVDDLLGRTIYDFVAKKTADGVTARDRDAIKARAIRQTIVDTFDPDGTIRALMVTRFPIFDLDGNVTGVGGISTDITDRRRAEEALLRAKEEAEFASRAKTEFLANMSHELRTPLNSIIGFAEMLEGEYSGPIGGAKNREYVGAIKDSGTHLLRLIKDILDVSKIEAGMAELTEEHVRIRDIAESCHRMIRNRAEKAGLSLDLTLPESLPDLLCDSTMVKQILINLLANAVKFTPTGGKVTTRGLRDESGAIVLSVTDTGVGIAPEDIALVVEPFQQVGGFMTRREGVGLGLALAKALTELHGGILTIESAVGTGTVVAVRFPPERTVQS